MFTVSTQEEAHILAALRHCQVTSARLDKYPQLSEGDPLGDSLPQLTDEQIDALCEHISQELPISD